MGKKLEISTFFLALIGAGLGGYVFVTNTIFPMIGITESPSVQNTWFIQSDSGCDLGVYVYEYLSPNSHVISVNQDESVYILFTGYHRFSSTATDAWYAILIDGLTISATVLSRTSTGTERTIISMQDGSSELTPGTHNISIWGYSNAAFQECYRTALLVQTYI